MAFPFSGITPKPPTVISGARPAELLTDAGGAVVKSTVKLRVGEFATLVIAPTLAGISASEALAVVWSSDANHAATTSDPLYAAGSVISWEVDMDSTYVSVIDAGGASEYRAWLYRSS